LVGPNVTAVTKRVVVGTDPDGTSMLVSAGPPVTVFQNPKGDNGRRIPEGVGIPENLSDGELVVAELWATQSAGMDGSDPTEGVAWSSGCEPGATRWRMVVHGPNRVAPMHRTNTVDYDLLVDGELVLVLDEGEVNLVPGDCVILPGARHGWRAGPRGARLMVFMLGLESADE
jgi:quercetin dioxygenase-like cupin family protein